MPGTTCIRGSMKILLVNDYGTPDGGAEIATFSLRDGLRRRGHDARLFTTSTRGSIASQGDIEYAASATGYRARLLQTANVTARGALKRTLAQFRPDVVHVGVFLTQLSPLILPLLRDVPSVYYAHWLRIICPSGSKLLPNGDACRRSWGPACYQSKCLPLRDWGPLMVQMRLTQRWRSVFRRVVANSEATRLALESAGFANVGVIPCGVPTVPRRSPFRGPPVACFTGRLTRQKGVHVLVAAWNTVRRALPNAELVIVGDGPDRRALEASAPPGVTFLGTVPRHEVDAAVAHAWVHVVPSTGFEGLGLAAIEAMMRGRPVVASRAGGLAEVVRHDATGVLVEPNDSTALAEALISLLQNPVRCEQMGACGRDVAERSFSVDGYVERFLAVYEALVAEPRPVS
jgi:glycosyltransferase involved in cell wall biosynthesis